MRLSHLARCLLCLPLLAAGLQAADELKPLVEQLLVADEKYDPQPVMNHSAQDVYVHRKGATPAGAGVLGVIPGSMADPGFIVRGRGNAASLDSASHGAGRAMSRTAARSKYNFRVVQRDLEKRGVTILSAGADEVPGVYKDIRAVMAAQSDLVDIVGRFDQSIVKMCGDGSKAED